MVTAAQLKGRRKLAAIFGVVAVGCLVVGVYGVVVGIRMDNDANWPRRSGTLDISGVADRNGAHVNVIWTDDAHEPHHGTINVDRSMGQRMLNMHAGDPIDIRVFTPPLFSDVVCPAFGFDTCVEENEGTPVARYGFLVLGLIALACAVYVRYGKLTRNE